MSRPRILFVDDEPSITQTIRVALRKEPWEILAAESGESALALLEKTRAHVVISDEKMPGMGGAAFLVEVRKKWPETIRMMLTGQATLEDAMHAINDGEIWRFFLKPTDIGDLKQSIRQALVQVELMNQSRRLLATAKAQAARSTGQDPELSKIERDADGSIVIEATELDAQSLIEQMKALCDGQEQRFRQDEATVTKLSSR